MRITSLRKAELLGSYFQTVVKLSSNCVCEECSLYSSRSNGKVRSILLMSQHLLATSTVSSTERERFDIQHLLGLCRTGAKAQDVCIVLVGFGNRMLGRACEQISGALLRDGHPDDVLICQATACRVCRESSLQMQNMLVPSTIHLLRTVAAVSHGRR